MPQPSERPLTPALTLEELWPPFGLRIQSARIELRVVRETDFPAYVDAATSGVTQTSRNPFRHARNEQEAAGLPKSALPRLWSTRSEIGPDQWSLMLGIFLKGAGSAEGCLTQEPGELIGMRDCRAEDWSVLRTIGSGSWLRADRQGQGLGTEAHAAMLLWAFDHFGAEYAESGASTWDERSRRVAETLGYFTAGTRRVPDAHGEKSEWEHMFRLPKNDLLRPPWQIQVTGNDRLRGFFGHD
ncbi:GNAT family N-acetyltransferase [Nesterenkonia sp. LB17]|uniref:GNAT family N-acetyltransferase n=1 Tax=unclassified Nesterenkonia TaxID=2629769 RepID=UPI001F4CA626|nr:MULTISPECIES: GNAT family protein [unclassified Nesterenkonia]MCH8563382.1 GNAT family N-acetyltransferase [Nesterenkonia sp. YGD6]MCH8566032.1 GNAT family N-acetyltransferase [Nesterenkonia sp. LB17]